MDAHVLVERKESVLSILLARPERRNAITVAMYAALADAIESAADNDSIRLITIEGQGEDFTAGNDLGDFLQEMPRPGSGEDLPVWRLLRALAKNRTPIVAAVHGNAVGIGTTMLFHTCLYCSRTDGGSLLASAVGKSAKRSVIAFSQSSPMALISSLDSPSSSNWSRSASWSSTAAGCRAFPAISARTKRARPGCSRWRRW